MTALRVSASDDKEEAASAGSKEIVAEFGQEVRKGVKGWTTVVNVDQPEPTGPAAVAKEGDTVTVSFVCQAEGQVLVSSEDEDQEPLTFEIGSGDIMGNPLFKGFDEAVRGLPVGACSRVTAGGEVQYDKALMFRVPLEHPEVARLTEEFGQGGLLVEGTVVTLANGQTAVVYEVLGDEVVLDANHPLAGAPLEFEVTLLSIES